MSVRGLMQVILGMEIDYQKALRLISLRQIQSKRKIFCPKTGVQTPLVTSSNGFPRVFHSFEKLGD